MIDNVDFLAAKGIIRFVQDLVDAPVSSNKMCPRGECPKKSNIIGRSVVL